MFKFERKSVVVLPVEIVLNILEHLATYADIVAPGLFLLERRDGRRRDASGIRYLLSSRLVCRQFNEIIRPLVMEHCSVMELHPKWWEWDDNEAREKLPGAREHKQYHAPLLQMQDMMKHNEQLSLFKHVRSLTFDLGEHAYGTMPNTDFAITAIEFLLSLSVSLEKLVFAFPVEEGLWSSIPKFRQAVKLQGVAAGQNLAKVRTVALGRLCEFILELCPNVQHVASYGDFQEYEDLDPSSNLTHWELLINAAADCKHLAHFDMVGVWIDYFLRLVADKLPDLLTLGIRGALAGLVDHTPITHSASFVYLLERMPNLKTLVLPLTTAFHLFVPRPPWFPEADEKCPYSPLELPPAKYNSKWFCDSASWHVGNGLENRETRYIKNRYQYAYKELASYVTRICPQVETIWLDFGKRTRAEYSRWDHVRDLRIHIMPTGSTEDDLQIETSWEHLRSLPFDGKALIKDPVLNQRCVWY